MGALSFLLHSTPVRLGLWSGRPTQFQRISRAIERMVGKTELFLICLVAVALLAIVARKIRVPYPILLTLGGVGLAVIPGLPTIHLEPKLVFDLFLPPLLYPAAIFTSWRDFRANLRSILPMAIVLVL